LRHEMLVVIVVKNSLAGDSGHHPLHHHVARDPRGASRSAEMRAAQVNRACTPNGRWSPAITRKQDTVVAWHTRQRQSERTTQASTAKARRTRHINHAKRRQTTNVVRTTAHSHRRCQSRRRLPNRKRGRIERTSLLVAKGECRPAIAAAGTQFAMALHATRGGSRLRRLGRANSVRA
jgi:hypothetical protein